MVNNYKRICKIIEYALRSESLYRLNYRGYTFIIMVLYKKLILEINLIFSKNLFQNVQKNFTFLDINITYYKTPV
jgi:hypothetical protein